METALQWNVDLCRWRKGDHPPVSSKESSSIEGDSGKVEHSLPTGRYTSR